MTGGFTRRTVVGAACGVGGLVQPAHGQSAPGPGDPRLVNHAGLGAALELLQRGQWQDLSALVSEQTPDGMCVLLDDLGNQSPVDLDMSALTNEANGNTISGALLANWAWRYRGSGAASAVTSTMAQAFSDRLRRARIQLDAAIAADEDDGVAFNFLFRTFKGLSDVQAMRDAWPKFEAATRKPIRAFASFADALTPRWFGSEPIMVTFTRSQQMALEPTSHALIALAANEHIFTRWQDSLEAAMSFGSDFGVLAEVSAANRSFLAATDADIYRARFAHGHFSFFFSFLGLHDLARPHLLNLGNRIASPWTRAEDPVELLQRARALAGIRAV